MSDDQISVLRAINQGIADLRKASAAEMADLVAQVTASVAATQAITAGLAVINTTLTVSSNVQVVQGGATGAATMDIALPAGADSIDIDLQISPVTDNRDILVQVGAGGVIFSGATDYWYATLKGATQSTSAGASSGLILPAADTLASQVRLRVWRPSQPVRHFITWSGVMLDQAAGALNAVNGGCRFSLNTDPIDNLRLLASAGSLINATYSARITLAP